jgi:flagellar protein FlbD
MIAVTHPTDDLYLNPDQVQMIEGTPDTVVTLINGSKFVIAERPEEIADLIRRWRASILAEVSVVRHRPDLRIVE